MDKSFFRTFFSRVSIAVAKSLLVITVFLVFSPMLTPLNQIFSGASKIIETYIGVYVVFIILGELAKGTLFQHALGMGRAFLLIGYTLYALNDGMITQTIQSITFSANLQIFLAMIIFVGTLDLAESLLQIINHLANKAETETITAPSLEQEIPAA